MTARNRVIYTNSFAAHTKDSFTAEVIHNCGGRALLLFDDATTCWAYPEEMEVIA